MDTEAELARRLCGIYQCQRCKHTFSSSYPLTHIKYWNGNTPYHTWIHEGLEGGMSCNERK